MSHTPDPRIPRIQRISRIPKIRKIQETRDTKNLRSPLIPPNPRNSIIPQKVQEIHGGRKNPRNSRKLLSFLIQATQNSRNLRFPRIKKFPVLQEFGIPKNPKNRRSPINARTTRIPSMYSKNQKDPKTQKMHKKAPKNTEQAKNGAKKKTKKGLQDHQRKATKRQKVKKKT